MKFFIRYLATIFFCCYATLSFTNNQYLLGLIQQYVPLDAAFFEALKEISQELPARDNQLTVHTSRSPILFDYYPALAEKIAYSSLAILPTPVHRLPTIEAVYNIKQLWIKRDDATNAQLHLTTKKAGGNKVRKLEFLLADALKNGATHVITFGCVGSNHAVATSCGAQALGLQSICMLTPQQNNKIVQRNLKRLCYYNSTIHVDNTFKERCEHTGNIIKELIEQNHAIPYVIPTGGSSPLGILGYVNAMFELQEQIEQQLLPEPDYIYVTNGTFGTTVGLLLGLKATGLTSKIISVMVAPERTPGAFAKRLKILFEQTNQFLHNLDESFPIFEYSDADIEINVNCTGPAYGEPCQEETHVIDIMQDLEQIQLEETYTGKTIAALLQDAQKNILEDKIVLYWHTYDANHYLDNELAEIDYHLLPQEVHHYFE